jgi:hypothetical protein
MPQKKNSTRAKSRLNPSIGYTLLIVWLLGCAGGAVAVYKNRGEVPEKTTIQQGKQ